MSAYLVRRLGHTLVVLAGVSLLAMLLVHLTPGDPATRLLGFTATPEEIAAFREMNGLDDPLPVQFVGFTSRALRGDLGVSLFTRRPVVDMLLERAPVTLWLLAYAGLLTAMLTVPLASLAALRRDRMTDHLVRAVPMLGIGMPSFWIGIVLLYLAALRYPLFPAGGLQQGVLGHLLGFFLPAASIAIGQAPLFIRSLRGSMVEVLDAEFVTAARSRGVHGWRLITGHVLRNAAIPTITLFTVNLGMLVGGAVVVETVFSLPGLGSLMLDAVTRRDLPVIQGVALVFAAAVVLVNLLTDVVYGLVDPRVVLR